MLSKPAKSVSGGKSTSGSVSKHHASEPPMIPEHYPDTFKLRKCQRCGSWNLDKAPYDQLRSPEKAWGEQIAWEQGTPENPRGGIAYYAGRPGSELSISIALAMVFFFLASGAAATR